METCTICNTPYPSESLTEFDEELLCPDCLERETILCHDCGERIRIDDNTGTPDFPLCVNCYESSYTTCDHFSRWTQRQLDSLASRYGYKDRPSETGAQALELAVGKLNFLKFHGKREEIIFGMGSILRIDKTGRSMSEFSTDRLMLREYGFLSDRYTSADILYEPESIESYLDDLKSVAGVFGFSPGEVETMAASGMTPDEIESCFYDGWF